MAFFLYMLLSENYKHAFSLEKKKWSLLLWLSLQVSWTACFQFMVWSRNWSQLILKLSVYVIIDNMSMLMQTYMMIWYLVEFILAMQRNLPKYVHVHVMVPDGDSYGEHRRLKWLISSQIFLFNFKELI